MKKILIIEADHNDGDYVTAEHDITKRLAATHVMAQDYDIDGDAGKETFLEWITRVATAIKNCDAPYNWPASEYADGNPKGVYRNVLSSDDIDIFDEFVPSAEHGIHTIESIRILTVADDVDLLK